jgi:SAM-dependent methyltransferase
MPFTLHLIRNKDNKVATQQNISYYNEIADNYDELMARQDYNARIRQKVKEKMLALVPPGWVLDFGGGTGLDLPWLTGHHYNVIFCEPSAGMREKAVDFANHTDRRSEILFLEDEHTDFNTWEQELPFSQQTDAILANFGVFNNIDNLDRLFKNLSLVIKPGGYLITLVLERSIPKMLQWHRRNALRTLFLRTPFVMYVWNGDHQQVVFVHTIGDIKKAAAPYFTYCTHEPLKGFGFTLIQFARK